MKNVPSSLTPALKTPLFPLPHPFPTIKVPSQRWITWETFHWTRRLLLAEHSPGSSVNVAQQRGFPDYRWTPAHLLTGQRHREYLAAHRGLELKRPIPSRCSGRLWSPQDVRSICPGAGEKAGARPLSMCSADLRLFQPVFLASFLHHADKVATQSCHH